MRSNSVPVPELLSPSVKMEILLPTADGHCVGQIRLCAKALCKLVSALLDEFNFPHFIDEISEDQRLTITCFDVLIIY